MEDLILYWAVSEWPPGLIAQAQGICRQIGARPMVASEPRYNLLYRYPELDLFPVTRSEGIGNLTFSPLAHGLLTGKYIPGEAPPEGSRGADPIRSTYMKELYWTEENMKKGQELVKLAKEVDATASQLAIAWQLTLQDVTSAILGAKSVEQLEENIKAEELKLSEEVIRKIEEIYPLIDVVPRITRHH